MGQALHQYGSVGVLTQISRGWNLTRLHGKEAFLLLIIPILIMVASSVVQVIPQAYSHLVEKEAGLAIGTVLTIVCFGISLVLGFVGWTGLGFAFVLLAHRFYFSLLGQTPPKGWIKQFLNDRWPPLLGVFFVLLVMNVFFVFAEIATFFGGLIISGILMAIIGIIQDIDSKIGGGLVALFVGFLTVSLLYVEFVLQMLFSMFPIIAVATLPCDNKLFQDALGSLGLLWRRPYKTLLFGTGLIFFYMFLALFFQIPLYAWMGFEIPHMSQEDMAGGNFPIHLLVTIHVWGAFVSGVVWVFVLGATSLFFYDCQMSVDGMDLKYRLDSFKARWIKSTPLVQSVQ
jgi:hypothetical protein